MIEAYTEVSRSGSVARPIMKDSHSFDLGSNPNRSMILLVILYVFSSSYQNPQVSYDLFDHEAYIISHQ